MRDLTHLRTILFQLAALVALVTVSGCGVRGATEAEMANGKNLAGTGAVLYERQCESCHGDHGQGATAPAVLGKQRYAHGKFKNAQELFDYVAKNMPQDKPGSLDITQYWNIVTFVVATTGTPMPGDRLSESNAADVKFQ